MTNDAADKTQAWIDETVRTKPVVLFMKGTPQFPQCGFSASVVGILRQLGVAFADVNVLDDDRIRRGIKTYSDWPTIPQLYIGGTFVGPVTDVCSCHAAGSSTP